MKSEWKVTSQFLGDTKKYAVYRLLNAAEVDHSGNREFAGDYISDVAMASLVASQLNVIEAQNALAGQSDYVYHVNSAHGRDVLVIEDLNLGRLSVTNNIEAIVDAIALQLGGNIYFRPIVYRDSEGRYDGINGHEIRNRIKAPFYRLGETTEEAAVAAVTKREEEVE